MKKNENQALAQEMLLKALLSKQNESADVLSILSMMVGDLEAGIKQANEGIAAVKKDTEQIGAKLDKVIAPSDTVWAHSDGKLTIGPKSYINNGEWKEFIPRKRGR